MTRLITLALTTAAYLPLSAQTARNDARPARVDSIMSSFVSETGPGAAIAVIQNGNVVYQRGYGLANIDAKLPISTTTTFDLASVSKQFTAMAIMMLAERGAIGYDDPLTKFFPAFPPYASKITVRHLLNHTSGLPDYMSVFRQRPAGISPEPTGREAITMLSQIAEPRFTPGDKWEYSNSGYVVLAQIVEKAAGMSFPEFMKRNVFGPLDMRATLVSDQIKAPAVNRAISYAQSGNGYTNADYSPLNRIYGDGNVNTSVEDMFKWDQALYTDRLVKQRTLEDAFTPAKLNDGSATDYGFGWTIANTNGLRVVSHGGAWVGFRTNIMRIPSERFSVVVLSNAADFNPGGAAKRIANVYLGDKVAVKPMVPVDEQTLASYAGKYELRPGLILDISLARGALYMMPTGQANLRLAAESSATFYVLSREEIGVTFNRDEAGKISGLTLHQGRDMVARRLPE